jgi:ATP-dependent Clp protease ATP-binding subunit ClpC
MLRQPEGLISRLIQSLSVDVGALKQRIERELEKAPKVYGQYGFGGQIYITPRTQRLVKRAEEEAARLSEQLVGVEHLLITLSGEAEGASARILKSFGTDQEHIYRAVMELRRDNPAEAAQPQKHSGALSKEHLDIDEITALRQQITELELQNQHLQEMLRVTQESLGHTRGLLEKEITQRHWVERHRIEREAGGEEHGDA